LLGCLVDHDLYEQRRAELIDEDGDGYNIAAGDCDDADPARYPGAAELCDEADNDCDGDVDEDLDESYWFTDIDGDGYGTGEPVLACGPPAGAVADGTDCDDSEPGIHPGAVDEPYDGVDGDCVGGDEDDLDDDGFAAVEAGGADCDDSDPDVHPDMVETWGNGSTDNDCDGDYGAAVLMYGADAWTGEAAGDNAGRRITSLGDLDGDGTTEFMVGAPYQSNTFDYGGALYVVYGADPGPLSEEGVLLAEKDYQLIGASIDGGVDMTGDGVPDVLASAANDEGGAGRVWLLSGAALPGEGEARSISELSSWTITGDEPGTSQAMVSRTWRSEPRRQIEAGWSTTDGWRSGLVWSAAAVSSTMPTL
jgi:hypothetical protein